MTSLYARSNAAFALPPARPLSSPHSTFNPSPFTRREHEGINRFPSLLPIAALSLSIKSAIHQDDEGNCIFGTKKYWDQMYNDQLIDTAAAVDHRPSDAYSWYCGWDELQPFWTMLVPDQQSQVVIAGIGNDPAPVGMYDAGWTKMMGYDYSASGVDRARELFGVGRNTVGLITADARSLPLEASSVGATLDKGTLDAIYITGKDIFRDSVVEMGRVTATDGCVVSISTVIDPEELLGAFDNPLWECVHDGGLAFAPDGEATIDLGAELYSWKRTAVPYDK